MQRADDRDRAADAAGGHHRRRCATPCQGASGAAVLVYVPHTTAGLTINEHADPMVARDFEMALERIAPEGWGWQHIEEGEENAPSHIRAALMGPQVVIPLARRRARARHLAGHLPLRARRAANALGARHRAPVGSVVGHLWVRGHTDERSRGRRQAPCVEELRMMTLRTRFRKAIPDPPVARRTGRGGAGKEAAPGAVSSPPSPSLRAARTSFSCAGSPTGRRRPWSTSSAAGCPAGRSPP